MRQYAWYSPDADEIVLQTIVDECTVAFEWDFKSMGKLHSHATMHNADIGDYDPMDWFVWVPLGEL